MHGSVFEFVRNAAFDARNYFDHRSAIGPRRIPPFARNEFGLTNGGPIVLPGNLRRPRQDILFRRVSGIPPGAGHNASLPVPTAAERQGIDTTTVPGDTLFVPVNRGNRCRCSNAISAAKRTDRRLRRSNLCGIFEGGDATRISSRFASITRFPTKPLSSRASA